MNRWMACIVGEAGGFRVLRAEGSQLGKEGGLADPATSAVRMNQCRDYTPRPAAKSGSPRRPVRLSRPMSVGSCSGHGDDTSL